MNLGLEAGIDVDALGRAARGAYCRYGIEQLLGVDRARGPHHFLIDSYDV